jgi:hypothetical protein
METVTARDILRGWFWGMIALAVVASVGVRLAWVYALGIRGSAAAGDFVAFAVILGMLSRKTTPIAVSVARRVTAIVVASAAATGILALLRMALL